MCMGIGLALMLCACAFAVVGGVVCLWAGYEYLVTVLDQTLAAFIIGMCAIAVAGVCVWAARRLTH